MLPIWTSLFSLLLSIIIVAFNLLVLLATAIHPRLHTISNTLSCNLWIANCFTGVVAIFHNLFYPSADHPGSGYIVVPGFSASPNPIATPIKPDNQLHVLGPQTLAALFNSTVSLVTLLVMALVQIFIKFQNNWLPRSAPARISLCLWSAVIAIILINYSLIHITQSLSLIVAFQLALLSIFLIINLILHPANLVIASRAPNNAPYLAKAITQSLWLLLHSLSFTLLAMILVWETSQSPAQQLENAHIINMQLAAYSVHCIANPVIAMLRDPRLLSAIGSLVNAKDSPTNHHCSLISQDDLDSTFYGPENWIFRHLPPPPPYDSSLLCADPSTSTLPPPSHHCRRNPFLRNTIVVAARPSHSHSHHTTQCIECEDI